VTESRSRPAWADIDLEAVRHNTELVRRVVAPAALCAVVKADAYGHGAAAVARAALDAGAAGLAVAHVEEGVELRKAEIEGPILLLAEPPVGTGETVVAHRLTPTLADPARVAEIGDAARLLGTRHQVHVKVDTGMHRLGAAPDDVLAVAKAIVADPALVLEGVWTHLAVADGASVEDRVFTTGQLAAFDEVLDHLAAQGLRPPVRHAANSGGAIAWPEARYTMVRCGIALYGYHPTPAVAEAFAAAVPGEALRPVMSLRACVTAVRVLDAGVRPSYGRRRPLAERSVVATVPLGYADGVPRAMLDAGMEVLIGGRRRPLAGTVTMDQLMVDCGPAADVGVGDEVVLLGRQGAEEITADEWAARLGTISYEVLCGIGPRVARTTGAPTAARWRSGLGPHLERRAEENGNAGS